MGFLLATQNARKSGVLTGILGGVRSKPCTMEYDGLWTSGMPSMAPCWSKGHRKTQVTNNQFIQRLEPPIFKGTAKIIIWMTALGSCNANIEMLLNTFGLNWLFSNLVSTWLLSTSVPLSSDKSKQIVRTVRTIGTIPNGRKCCDYTKWDHHLTW